MKRNIFFNTKAGYDFLVKFKTSIQYDPLFCVMVYCTYRYADVSIVYSLSQVIPITIPNASPFSPNLAS